MVVCGVPPVAVMEAAAPAVLVSEKLTLETPEPEATTAKGPPAVPFAVNTAEATPEPLVATVIVAVALLKVPEAPLPGAVKVTL